MKIKDIDPKMKEDLFNLYLYKDFYYLLNKKAIDRIRSLIKTNFKTINLFLNELNKNLRKPLSNTILYRYFNYKTYISGIILKELEIIFSINFKLDIIAIKSAKSGLPIKNPNLDIKLTPELAGIIGHLLGDGGISNNQPFYFNKNMQLINKFKKDCYKVFGNFKINETVEDGVVCLRLPVIIGRLLKPLNKKYSGSNITIPQVILNADKNIKAAFLRALFDDESSVLNSTISIEMTSKHIIYNLPSLLEEFGIQVGKISSRKREHWRRTYSIRISGEKDFINFYKYIGFEHPKKMRLLLKKINSYKIHKHKKFMVRKEILSLLSEGSLLTSELLKILKIKGPCLSNHIKKLKEEGLIDTIQGSIERDSKGRFINIYENRWTLKSCQKH